VLEQILGQRQSFLRNEQKKRLERILNSSAEAIHLKGSNARQIISDLLTLEEIKVKLQQNTQPQSSYGSADSKANKDMVHQLQSQTGSLTALIHSSPPNPASAPTIQAKKYSLHLAANDQEIKHANDSKLVPYVDLRQNSNSTDTSIRIGINIPFTRFDKSLQWQDQVRLYEKRKSLEQETRSLVIQSTKEMHLLNNYSLEVQSLLARQEKVLSLQKALLSINDSEVAAFLQETQLRIEKDLIDRTSKFYDLYFNYLKDQGFLANRPGTNFLDSRWASL
jgi:hypothetical protein